MRAHQRGVTAIGWLVLLIPFAVVFYAGIRLTPIYLNYMNVARTLNDVKGEFQSGGAAADTIRAAISRHFEIDAVNYPKPTDLAITHDGLGWHVEAAYEDQAPLFGNITLQVTFDKTVTLGGGGGGD